MRPAGRVISDVSVECLVGRARALRRVALKLARQLAHQIVESRLLATKWQRDSPSVQIDDIVACPVAHKGAVTWVTGRVTEVKTSRDGQVRTATVKHSKGELQRSVRQIAAIAN